MKHQLKNTTNLISESGRSMLEIIAVLSIMGLLSIAIAWGYIQASRRETAVTLSDLVTKSVAGVVTSQVLEQVAATYEPVGNGNMLAIGDVIPLDTYISNVGRVSPGSEEERLYGREAFIASRGTVISAYALARGQGVVVKLNRFSSEVCDILLSSGLDYEGVIDLNNANGKIVPWEDLEDGAVRSELCTPHEAGKTLDLGFVFENTGRDPLPTAPCNPACLVDVLGQCGLKTEIPCDRGSCDRRDFIVQACEWMCIGKTNQDEDDNCVCPTSMVWDATARECVSCLSNDDCHTRNAGKPVCENPGVGSSCVSCPTDQVYDTTRKECVSCSAYTNGLRPVYKSTDDGVGECVECLDSKLDCAHPEPVCLSDNTCGCTQQSDCGAKEVCDATTKACTACPGDLVGQADNTCACPANTYPKPDNATICVACTADEHCSGSTPVCDTTTYTCSTCAAVRPLTPHWLKDKCVECTEKQHCTNATKPICLTDNTCGCTQQSDCGAKGICDTDKKECTTCAGDLVGDAKTNTCICPTGKVPHPTDKTKCVACTADEHCSGKTPVCDTRASSATLYTCQACATINPAKPQWNGKECIFPTYTITWNNMGTVTTESVLGGTSVKSKTPTWSKVVFSHWSTDKDGNNKATFPMTINADKTFYAQYKDGEEVALLGLVQLGTYTVSPDDMNGQITWRFEMKTIGRWNNDGWSDSAGWQSNMAYQKDGGQAVIVNCCPHGTWIDLGIAKKIKFYKNNDWSNHNDSEWGIWVKGIPTFVNPY